MNDQDTLYHITKEALEPRLQEQFYNGMIAGYQAALEVIWKHISPMTSAKAIKEYIHTEMSKRQIKANENAD